MQIEMTNKNTVLAKANLERHSGIELFRIITMILIVAHHYVVNSGLDDVGGLFYTYPFTWKTIVLLVFGAWGKTGINCFVMITGYYLCKSKISFKKFVKLLLEILFYRYLINTVFWITGYAQFSLVGLIKVLIPVRVLSYDFTTAFIVFYLFIPFLRFLVQQMDERQHILLILWCGFSYVFLGTIPGFNVTMNYVSWFSVLFVIASYIRLYPKKAFDNTRLWAVLTVMFVLLSIFSIFGCIWVHSRIGFLSPYSFVTDSNSFLAVALGLSSFMLFKNLKIGYSKTINTIAASTFGVLLIHANSDTMRQWLWKDTLDVVGHYGSKFMPLHAIGSVLAIFIICTVIDQIRIRFIEKPFFRLWDKHWDGFLSKYKKLESKFFSKIGVQE